VSSCHRTAVPGSEGGETVDKRALGVEGSEVDSGAHRHSVMKIKFSFRNVSGVTALLLRSLMCES
jgi:hypothetical protein